MSESSSDESIDFPVTKLKKQARIIFETKGFGNEDWHDFSGDESKDEDEMETEEDPEYINKLQKRIIDDLRRKSKIISREIQTNMSGMQFIKNTSINEPMGEIFRQLKRNKNEESKETQTDIKGWLNEKKKEEKTAT